MRIFISHSSSNNLEARAVMKWLTTKGEIPGEEIFLDIDPDSGILTGKRWKEELRRAASRCEAVICLLSRQWEASKHCNVEYLYSEDLRKTIIVGRIEDMEATSITSEWQRCDLFIGDGPGEDISLASGETVELSAVGLQRLLAGIRSLGIGVEHFQWPPTEDPGRAPYRGWAALDRYDAAVYFGRDAEIVRGLDVLRGMRTSGIESMLVIQGPSGAGKSAFLRAGLLPRLYRDDRRFLPMGVVRPALNALTGDTGLGASIFAVRKDLGLTTPGRGEIKKACRPDNVDQLRGWLQEARDAQYERVKDETTAVPPTLVLPLDQGEELFTNDAKGEAAQFLQIAADLMEVRDGVTPAVITVATIRSDSYEPLQTAPQLTGIGSKSFNDLKAMSSANFAEVITGPAKRIEREGQRLEIDPRLVKKLTEEYGTPDALPLLALTLSRLYAEYHDDGDLTLEEYKLMGGLKEVVQREVDLILGVGRTRKSNLKILRKAFIPRLATVDPDNGNPRRNLAKWSELPSDSHRLIEAFIKSRLLVVRTPQDDKEAIDEDDEDVVVGDDEIVADNDPVVEVALESLMRNWAELAEWLSVEGEDLKLAERITRAAREWDNNRQDDEYLDLRGTRLEDAERIATKKGFNHGDWWNLSRQFLKRCREREESLAAERDQAAADKEASQAAEIQLLREKKESAEAYASDIADRESKLKESERRVRRWLFGTVATALATVVAVVFVALFAHTADVATERADNTKQLADKQFEEATALRLVNETEAVLYRRSPDGDFRALQQAVVAPRIDPLVDQSALLDMVVNRRDLLKVVNTGLPVTAVAAGADGTLLATSDAKGVLRIWKADSAEQVGGDIDTGHGTVWTVAFIGNSVVTGSNDGTVIRWDLDSKEPTPLMVSTDGPAVRSVAVSSDDRTIVAASVDGTVRVWNAIDNAPFRPHIRTDGDALAVAVHGDMVATGSKFGFVELWDLRALDRRPVELTVGGGEVWSVAFSPNGDQLAVAGQNNDVTLWNTANGTKSDVKIPHHGGVWTVAYNAKGDRLVTGGTDDLARVWNATTGASIVTDESDNGLAGDNGDVKSAVFVGDNVATASDDGTFRLWRPEPIIERGTASGSPVASLAFVGDSTVVVDDARQVRTMGGTDQIKQLESGPGAAPAVSSDGSTLTVASPGGSIQTWNLADQTSIGPEIKTGQGDVTALAVGGGRIASRNGKSATIRLWDVHTGVLSNVSVAVGDEKIGVTALSPDGTKLAAAMESGRVRVWDTVSGAVVVEAIEADQHPDYGQRTVNAIAFSPDGARIVTAARGDDSVREFDAATGKELGLMYGHHRDVASAAYSRDGRYIASGDYDGALRVWDTTTHRPVGLPITTDPRPVTRIAFGPRDESLVVGVVDGAVRTLPGPAAWSDELCSKLTHNMSETEWDAWVTPKIDDIEACEGLPRRPNSR